MAVSNEEIVDKTVEIVKAYASGGGGASLDYIIQQVYDALKKINAQG